MFGRFVLAYQQKIGKIGKKLLILQEIVFRSLKNRASLKISEISDVSGVMVLEKSAQAPPNAWGTSKYTFFRKEKKTFFSQKPKNFPIFIPHFLNDQ